MLNVDEPRDVKAMLNHILQRPFIHLIKPHCNYHCYNIRLHKGLMMTQINYCSFSQYTKSLCIGYLACIM